MTQFGWRSIQKCQKWVEPSETEAWLRRDVEDWGTNHDRVIYVKFDLL